MRTEETKLLILKIRAENGRIALPTALKNSIFVAFSIAVRMKLPINYVLTG